jgi:ubiquinone/menaquinone biosynthesis C-methylase UbiE
MSTNAQYVSKAFSKQSKVFDTLNRENKISEYLRNQFRQEVLSHLKPASEILELNCGTGLDAVFFAQHGHKILANDNAEGMLAQLKEKIAMNSFEKQIEIFDCSFHEIRKIENIKFDHIISNFGGLNCTGNLDEVLQQFSPLLKPGGKVTLMIMPKICPWELALVFKGKFKTAFRRMKKKALANVEGVQFYCYYYSPAYVQRVLKKDFSTVSLKGICVTVPPEFMKGFVEHRPRTFEKLKSIDNSIGGIFPFTYCCDHFLITLEKTG